MRAAVVLLIAAVAGGCSGSDASEERMTGERVEVPKTLRQEEPPRAGTEPTGTPVAPSVTDSVVLSLLVDVGSGTDHEIVKVEQGSPETSVPVPALNGYGVAGSPGGTRLLAVDEAETSVRGPSGETQGVPFVWEGEIGWNASGTLLAMGLEGGGMTIMDGAAEQIVVNAVSDEARPENSALGLGAISFFSWLGDQHLLVGASDEERIATIEGDVLVLGPTIAREGQDVSWLPDPGSDTVLDLGGERLEVGTVDTVTGGYSAIGSLADEGFQPIDDSGTRPNLAWAPAGSRLAIEQEGRIAVCRVDPSVSCVGVERLSGSPIEVSGDEAFVWAPDGKSLALTGYDFQGTGGARTWLINPDAGQAAPLSLPECATTGCRPVAFVADDDQ